MIYLLLAATGFLAALLQTSIGFGGAILLLNIIPFFLSPVTSIIICQATCLILSISVIVRCFKNIRWKIILPLVVPGVFFSIVFVLVSNNIETRNMKIILGFLFIVLSIYFLVFAEKIKLKPTVWAGLTMGSMSGVMNGIFSMGGPPAVLYLAPSFEDKEEYLASTQVFFAVCNLPSLIARLALGQGRIQDIGFIITCGLFAILGTLAGYKVIMKINQNLLKRFVYLFIGINGLIIVITNLI